MATSKEDPDEQFPSFSILCPEYLILIAFELGLLSFFLERLYVIHGWKSSSDLVLITGGGDLLRITFKFLFGLFYFLFSFFDVYCDITYLLILVYLLDFMNFEPSILLVCLSIEFLLADGLFLEPYLCFLGEF